MDPIADFIAEMKASKNLLGIDVFRVANTLSVKLCTLFESKTIDDIDVHKVRRSTFWSISTYNMTSGFGYTTEQDSWQERNRKIYRTIEKASLDYISFDTRKLRFRSFPGVSHIDEDDNGYRLHMTHRDLFSSTSCKLVDWKGHQLLKIDTKHMLDRSLEEPYWHYLSQCAPEPLPQPPRRSPLMTVNNAEIVQWYRNFSGAHSAAQYPHQLIGEKLPSGEFFVRPLLSSQREYFRAILGLQEIRKVVASLVLLLAHEVYIALTGITSNASTFVDVPKLVTSDSDLSVDITTVTSVPAARNEGGNNMIRHVDSFDPFIDERYRDCLIGFFPYGSSITPCANRKDGRITLRGLVMRWNTPTNLYEKVFEKFKRGSIR